MADSKNKQAIKRTVQEFPDVTSGPSIPRIILHVATAADEIAPWWSPMRDTQLRKFWPTEPFLAGAIYSVCSRNASFRWELTGPRLRTWRSHDMLNSANFGDGWQSFTMQISTDLITADNGAFIEVIRPAHARTSKGKLLEVTKAYDPEIDEVGWVPIDEDTKELCHDMVCGEDFKIIDLPVELPVGIAHLDSARCIRTGDPTYPVLYTDRKGGLHKLAAHQVITLEDMPSPIEEMNKVQTCAVSRCLRLAQILRDMLIYKHEKVSGRFIREVHITNADARQLDDAIAQAQSEADSKGLERYSQPVIFSTIDPTADPKVATIPLASLPDGFNEEETMRWYVAGVANALGVDYGFLAPLPGNKLGTSTQAETQERQARGKSSRLFMETLQNKFNNSAIFPKGVKFKFAESDPWEESERDRAFSRRARALEILVSAAIIEPWQARQILADKGDLDPKYLEMIGEADLTPVITVGNSDVPMSHSFTPKVDFSKFQRSEPKPINVGGDGSEPGGIDRGEDSNRKKNEE